jgi:hypothetical protein
MVTAAEQRGGGAQLDQTGRLTCAATNGSGGLAAPELVSRFGALLCANLGVVGSRVLPTATAHLAILTISERTGDMLEFWAGVALRPDPATALHDAAIDALLGPWSESVLVAGAARLVAAELCAAALITDNCGTTSIGTPDAVSPLTRFSLEPTAGQRLAAKDDEGEFRGLSLGSATIVCGLADDPTASRRVEKWFDVLETSLA